MRKVIAVASTFLAGALAHTHTSSSTHKLEKFPPLNLFTTFITHAKLQTFEDGELVSFREIEAVTKTDGERNKIHIDNTVEVPVLGVVDSEILIDATAGTFQLAVPALFICEQIDIPKFNLKNLLLKIYSEEGGITTYDGNESPEWDTKKIFDKFHADFEGSDMKVHLEAWVDQTSHNGRWLKVKSDFGLTTDGIVINVPKGEEEATFTDDDFVMNGCARFETNPNKLIFLKQ